VDDVSVYRTLLLPPRGEALEELRRGVDGITFTSPSTVRGFLQLGEEARRLLGGVVVATLGPAATEFARRAGIEVTAEAGTRSMSGLIDALREAF
jgi:uroporphyrinogen-III synthase